MKKSLSVQNLRKFYLQEKKSAADIAKIFQYSPHKVNYWLDKYNIPKRSISEAIYVKYHPAGDPFKIYHPKSIKEAKLFGLGLGIYWGEGNKTNPNTIRVGNSDPALLRIFIEFLISFFRIKKDDLRFHIHLFTDIDVKEAIRFWSKELKIQKRQFYKPMISKSGSLGTYRKKSKYGVLTVYYGNIKLKNILVDKIKEYSNRPL